MRNLSGGGAEVFTFTTKGSDNLQMQWGPLVRPQQPNMKQGLDPWTGFMDWPHDGTIKEIYYCQQK